MERNHLESLLKQGRQGIVTFFTASAGYGKTHTLKTHLANQDCSSSWFLFMPSDNDPALFTGKIERMLKQDPHLSDTGCLVFDDCHILTDTACINSFCDFLNSARSQYKIFILSRTNTIYETFQSFCSDSVLLVTGQTLAFTPEELKKYIQEYTPKFPYQAYLSLTVQTAGWPLAINTILQSLANFSFADDPKLNYAYLPLFNVIEETLFQPLPKPDQFLLLRLSIVETFSFRMLIDIYGENIAERLAPYMVLQYNKNTEDTQLHPLYLQFLKQKFSKLPDDTQQETYLAVGYWFYERKNYSEALYQYKHLHDYFKLWEILKQSFHHFNVQENISALLDMLKQFPESFISEHPKFRLFLAAAYYTQGSLESAKEVSCFLLNSLKETAPGSEMACLYGEALMYHGFLCMQTGNTDFADYMNAAYRYLPAKSSFMPQNTSLLKADQLPPITDIRPGAVSAWNTAMQNSINSMNSLFPKLAYGLDHFTAASTAYYQGDFYMAETNAKRALKIALEHHCTDIVSHAHLLLIKVCFHKGSYDKLSLYRESHQTFLLTHNQAPKSRLFEMTDIYYAMSQGNKVAFKDHASLFNNDTGMLLKAHHLLENKQYYELILHGKHMETSYKKLPQIIGLIYTYVFQGIAYYYIHKKEEATDQINAAWLLAGPDKILMPFIEHGQYIRTFFYYLKNCSHCIIPDEWLDKILGRSNTLAKKANLLKNKYDSYGAKNYDLKPLTKKEIEIIAKLSIGFSRNEIADYFQISPNTVKSTLRNIFTKLGASNSTNAIKIALENGYIS